MSGWRKTLSFCDSKNWERAPVDPNQTLLSSTSGLIELKCDRQSETMTLDSLRAVQVRGGGGET